MGALEELSGKQVSEPVVKSDAGKISELLLEAQSLLTKLKGRNITYPSLLYTPLQLCKVNEDDCVQAGQGWRRALTSGDSSGQAFLVNSGFDVSKFEQHLTQFKAPIVVTCTKDEKSQRKVVTSALSGLKGPIAKPTISTNAFYQMKRQEQMVNIISSQKAEEEEDFSKWMDECSVTQWNNFKKGHSKPFHFETPKKSRTGEGSMLQSPTLPKPTVILDVSREKLSLKQKLYGEVTTQFVQAHIATTEIYYPICGQLLKIAGTKLPKDQQTRSMVEILKFLTILTDEDKLSTRRIVRPKQRSSNDEIQRRHVESSILFLEKIYIEYMEKTLMQFPKEAKLGGRPTLSDKVRAFLSIKFNGAKAQLSHLDMVQGIPIWGHVFYLIRCGDRTGALAFVRSNSNIFYRLDSNFIMYLEKFLESEGLERASGSVELSTASSLQATGLPSDILSMIKKEYQEMRLNEHHCDPYKILLYEWLAKCANGDDAFVHPLVIATIEDWLWYQLCLLPSANLSGGRMNTRGYTSGVRSTLGSTTLSDTSHLAKFQKGILELGPDYFMQEERDPFVYFKILLFSGLYESAINYLYNFEDHKFSLEALHVAMILSYGKLLNFTNADSNTMTLDAHSKHASSSKDALSLRATVPMADYMSEYTNDLKAELPHTSFYYIISMFLFEQPQDCILNLLKDWTIKTFELSFSFGTMDQYGAYHDGELVKYNHLAGQVEGRKPLSSGSFDLRAQVARLAGKDLEESGNNLEALTFYHMAGLEVKVLEILCKTISDALTLFYYASSPAIFSTIQHAKSILEFYTFLDKRNAPPGISDVSARSSSSLGARDISFWYDLIVKLLAIFDALNNYHLQHYDQVFVKLHSAHLWPQPSALPLDKDTNTKVTEWVSFWKSSHLLLSRHLSRLLFVYMDSLQNKFKELQKPKRLLYETKNQIVNKIDELKNASRFSLLVAGNLQLSSELYGQIALIDSQLETFFNSSIYS